MEKAASATELRILEAARKVFQTRGFAAARMQEIADEAGVNKALVHYYFRNKETLFAAVFDEAFSELVARINEIFFSGDPIHNKVTAFAGYYVSFIGRNPYLPLFILNSLHERPEQVAALFARHKLVPGRLLDQIKNQVREETGREIDPMHIYINILSLSVFPVIAKPMIQTIFGFTDNQMDTFYSEREKAVPEFIFNAIKGYENKPVAPNP